MILQNKQKKRVCDFNLFTWAQGWHNFHLKKGKDFNVYGQINILWHWSYTNLLFMLKQSSLFLFDQFLNPSLGTVLITHIFSNHNVPACSDLCYWDQECPLLLFQIFFFQSPLFRWPNMWVKEQNPSKQTYLSACESHFWFSLESGQCMFLEFT